MPAEVRLNHKDGIYAIDSAHGERDDPNKNVLTWLVSLKFSMEGLQLTGLQGTLLEKFLTMPPEEFRRLLRDSPNPTTDSGETREAYRYAKVGGIGCELRQNADCLKIVTKICDALTTRLSRSPTAWYGCFRPQDAGRITGPNGHHELQATLDVSDPDAAGRTGELRTGVPRFNAFCIFEVRLPSANWEHGRDPRGAP